MLSCHLVRALDLTQFPVYTFIAVCSHQDCQSVDSSCIVSCMEFWLEYKSDPCLYSFWILAVILCYSVSYPSSIPRVGICIFWAKFLYDIVPVQLGSFSQHLFFGRLKYKKSKTAIWIYESMRKCTYYFKYKRTKFVLSRLSWDIKDKDLSTSTWSKLYNARKLRKLCKGYRGNKAIKL